MNEVVIRKINPEEIGIIVKLANEIWPFTYEKILSAQQIGYMMNMMYSPDALMAQLSEKHHVFVLAEANNEPLAFASYSRLSEGQAFKLHKLYVHQRRQGLGLGRQLIDYILEQVKQAGGALIELNVNRNNIAKHFYEKLGFQVVREEDIDIGNGYFMNDYVMRRLI